STRRMYSPAELRKVYDEKAAVNEAKKQLAKRESDLNEWISTHFDVYVEELGLVDPEKTPKDPKGHYLIGARGNRLEQAIDGTDKVLTREKATDKHVLSHELLLGAYESGKVSRT